MHTNIRPRRRKEEQPVEYGNSSKSHRELHKNYSVMTRPPAEDQQEAVTIKASEDLKRGRRCLM